MKQKIYLETKFARERHFTIKPTLSALKRRKHARQLTAIKGKLVAEFSLQAADPALMQAVERAAADAAALAWLTPCPALFFPGLFEEKVQLAQRYVRRQRRIQQGFRPDIHEAA